MSASPEVPSPSAPPLPDDIKALIAKEYERPVEEKAERKWVEKNASQLANMPSCNRCTANGLTTCVLLKTKVSCPNCTRAKIRCSRLDEELFDRVQLQRQDISRPDFDRILVELSVERMQTLKIKIPTPPSTSSSASESAYAYPGDSASAWSQFNLQFPGWQATNPYYSTTVQPPPMSAVDVTVAYTDLQHQKDDAELRARDLEEELKSLQQSLGVQSSTLFARDEEIQILKRKVEETSAANLKDSERVVQAENNTKALQEELAQIKATDVKVRESILAYQMKQNELVSENQRLTEQLEACIKDKRRLTRENEILAGEKEQLAIFRATSMQELRLEKDQAAQAAELKSNKKYKSKLAGLRKTLAEHEQDQNRRALVVHSTLSSLAVTLADCLRTTNLQERRLKIAHENTEELLKESLKWLPSKPSQLMSLFWGNVKIEEREEEDEEEEEDDDGGNERSGPSQRTPPYTPESSSSQNSRKRPRVQ